MRKWNAKKCDAKQTRISQHFKINIQISMTDVVYIIIRIPTILCTGLCILFALTWTWCNLVIIKISHLSQPFLWQTGCKVLSKFVTIFLMSTTIPHFNAAFSPAHPHQTDVTQIRCKKYCRGQHYQVVRVTFEKIELADSNQGKIATIYIR